MEKVRPVGNGERRREVEEEADNSFAYGERWRRRRREVEKEEASFACGDML